jgi:hypothetical protein
VANHYFDEVCYLSGLSRMIYTFNKNNVNFQKKFHVSCTALYISDSFKTKYLHRVVVTHDDDDAGAWPRGSRVEPSG